MAIVDATERVPPDPAGGSGAAPTDLIGGTRSVRPIQIKKL